MRWILALGAWALLGACVPAPHFDQRAPEIEGVVLRDGRPVAGVTVSYAVDRAEPQPCEGGTRWTKSDNEGKFHLERVGEDAWFIVMGDRRDVWRLCFEYPDGSRARFEEQGFWGGPKRQRVSCDLRGEVPVGAPIGLPRAYEAGGFGCVVEER
jgi:hypothetical protein